jgi:hypothetical protein
MLMPLRSEFPQLRRVACSMTKLHDFAITRRTGHQAFPRSQVL